MEALTTNLRLELEKTNQIFTSWGEAQQEWLYNNASNYDQKMEEVRDLIS